MWGVVHRVTGFVRAFGRGVDAGHAIRHGLPVPDRARRVPLAATRSGHVCLWWTDAGRQPR